MSLIILLIFSEDDSFNRIIHETVSVTNIFMHLQDGSLYKLELDVFVKSSGYSLYNMQKKYYFYQVIKNRQFSF